MKRGQRQVTLFDCQVKKRNSINSTTESVQQGQPTQCNVEADKRFHGLIEGVHADFEENVTVVQDLKTTSELEHLRESPAKESLIVADAVIAVDAPGDIALGTHQSPVQPIIARFPATQFGERSRSFNPVWYKTYPWIEYSCVKDAAFCYACCLFTTGYGKAEQALTRVGFRDWKHASEKKRNTGMPQHLHYTQASKQCYRGEIFLRMLNRKPLWIVD